MQTTTRSAADSTTDLLGPAAAGDRDAWVELVARYSPLLRARIRGFRLQEADAHDVMQTTWMRLAENLGRLHTPEHLAGWLATVASRECLKVLRAHGRTAPVDEVVLDLPDQAPGPEQIVVDRFTGGALRAAVGALPPRRRELLDALFAENRGPYARIAQEFGIPIGSLGPTRARALAELRTSLQRRGFTGR